MWLRPTDSWTVGICRLNRMAISQSCDHSVNLSCCCVQTLDFQLARTLASRCPQKYPPKFRGLNVQITTYYAILRLTFERFPQHILCSPLACVTLFVPIWLALRKDVSVLRREYFWGHDYTKYTICCSGKIAFNC